MTAGDASAGPPRDAVEHAVWIEPVALVLASAEGTLFSDDRDQVYVPIGISFGSNARALTIEATAIYLRTGIRSCMSESYQCRALVGLTVGAGVHQALSGSALRGAFVGVKWVGSAWADDPGVRGFAGRVIGGELGLGFDVGYQGRFGPLYVSPIFGVGLGVCLNCPSGIGSGPGWGYSVPDRGLRPALFVNLNLLRVGVVSQTDR